MAVVLSLDVPGALDLRLASSTAAVGPRRSPLLSVATRVRASEPTAPLAERRHLLDVALTLRPGEAAKVRLAYAATYPTFGEWPADQYRGLSLPPATVHVDGAPDVAAYSGPALVALPETDLSMPFNVATLQSTLVAFFVGSVAAGLARRSGRKKPPRAPRPGSPPR